MKKNKLQREEEALLEARMRIYALEARPEVREEAVREVILKAEERLCSAQQENVMSYAEFLCGQAKYIQKKWWILQGVLLLGMGLLLGFFQGFFSTAKVLGVTSSLFVILIIPEFWKNYSSHSMEIEGAALYSLRQIYAARMVLFGMTDVVMLSIFCSVSCLALQISLVELAVQFLIPMTVTANICFGVLCSRRRYSEGAAVSLCFIWSGVWLWILLRKSIYDKVIYPLGLVILAGALVSLAFILWRTLKACEEGRKGEAIWNCN